ncbi:probable F-actin-capping protein subunit beta isoform X4 [Malus sylvestris]|uniref:probable F-actin-capping protein subunit beta isoform X4 n=1 Tax=Malus sylvestris TaxID=3752 RepID=UPI0021ACAD96|nr:probable F-actin-capping protein subunit beta isoform X4 [Malus sylvestris]
MEAAMGLMRRMRRMPPKHTETALSALLFLLPQHSSDLLSQVDQPLQALCDMKYGKEFILCEYNRDADSYRYYEGGISSVYMWEDVNEGFVGCFLIKKDGSKTGQGRRGYLQEGPWDAIHVIEVGPEEEGTAHYRLTSTVMLPLTTDNESSGTFTLSGSIRRHVITLYSFSIEEFDLLYNFACGNIFLRGTNKSVRGEMMNMHLSIQEGHICNMGRMIEEMESKLRNSLDQLLCFLTCTLTFLHPALQLRLHNVLSSYGTKSHP